MTTGLHPKTIIFNFNNSNNTNNPPNSSLNNINNKYKKIKNNNNNNRLTIKIAYTNTKEVQNLKAKSKNTISFNLL